MSYVGNTNTTQAFTAAVDYFSGNGSTVAFTLSRPAASTAQVQAVVNNVPQNPTDAFTVLNNTITFTSAPSSGTNNIYVQYTSPITQIMQPGQGTVGSTQLATGAAKANLGLSLWSFYESGGILYFQYSGTSKFKIDSSGNLTVTGNVTAYGTM